MLSNPIWQFILFSVSLVTGGASLLWPEIGEWLLFIGGVGLLSLIWWAAWDQWGKYERQFIPMDKAIQFMFERTNAADFVAELYDSPHKHDAGRRMYHYNQIRLMNRQRILEIYGCRPPSDIIELVPENAFHDYSPSKDFLCLMNGSSPVYSKLSVKRGGLRKGARYIKKAVKNSG